MKEDLKKKIIETVNKVKSTKPVAGSITNNVTIDFVANAQLAVGGAACMVYLKDEGVNISTLGNSTYINMGTMIEDYKESMPATAKSLHENKKNWVLDPVGVGSGEIRTFVLEVFKEYKPQIIRGNASEIIALAKLWNLNTGSAEVKSYGGVENFDSISSAKDSAISLAKWTGGAVQVSGEVDMITDGKTIVHSYGGSPLMEKVTGFGCSLGGVCSVYACVADPFIAALTASQVYNLAGLNAAKSAKGPGSFKVNFLDELYNLTAEEIANNKFEIIEE